MDDSAVRRIAECIPHCGNVIAAPLASRKTLRDLLGNEVAEHREFAGEVVIDADHFFLEIRRSIRTAPELTDAIGNSSCRPREDARIKQGSRIRINHAGWDLVSWEVPAFYNSRVGTARAMREHN